MSRIRERAVQGLEVGDTFTVTRTFTEEDTVRFGELSRDFNPVHYDDRFVHAKKLPGPICHGLLVASMVTEVGGQIGWLASGLGFRFRRPVHFGDRVTCRVTIEEIDERGRAEAQAVLTNQDGVVVLEGTLTGYLPGPLEREILAALVSEADAPPEERPAPDGRVPGAVGARPARSGAGEPSTP